MTDWNRNSSERPLPFTRSRAVTFTINNFTLDDYSKFLHYKAAYIVVAVEEGESGTRHMQGYMHFDSAQYFTKLKKAFPTAHMEAAVAPAQANFDYCNKGDVAPEGIITEWLYHGKYWMGNGLTEEMGVRPLNNGSRKGRLHEGQWVYMMITPLNIMNRRRSHEREVGLD